MEILRELRAMGVGIAVDDFGTGQSSLIYLKHFPIDTVKIDKEFLRDVTSDETAAAIVSYVINLAHTLAAATSSPKAWRPRSSTRSSATTRAT